MEETITQEHAEEHHNPGLVLNQIAQDFLKETAKWARFLGILGFILCGFLLLCGIFGNLTSHHARTLYLQSEDSYSFVTRSHSVVKVLYIILALIHFFPALYAYRFGNGMQKSLMFADEEELTQSFGNLKSLYKFWGVLAIVYLCLVILIIISVIIITAFLTLRH